MPPKVVKIRGIKTLPIAEEPGPCLSDFSRDRESKKRETRAGEEVQACRLFWVLFCTPSCPLASLAAGAAAAPQLQLRHRCSCDHQWLPVLLPV